MATLRRRYIAPVSRDAALLLTMIVVGALWVAVHPWLWWRVVRHAGLSPAWRILATLLPPLTPAAALLKPDLRRLAALWIFAALLYLLLWSQQ